MKLANDMVGQREAYITKRREYLHLFLLSSLLTALPLYLGSPLCIWLFKGAAISAGRVYGESPATKYEAMESTTVSSEVWKTGIEEFKCESGVKVERTQIERLAKPQIDINGGSINLNVVISKLCLLAWQRRGRINTLRFNRDRVFV